MATLLSVTLGNLASAGPILDQQFDPGIQPSLTAGIGAADFAQSFTVGLTGVLSGVAMNLYAVFDNGGIEEDLIFDIRETRSGVPLENDSSVLASLILDGSTLLGEDESGIKPPPYYVDLSPFSLRVFEGDELAIVLRSTRYVEDSRTDFWWSGANSDMYASGNAFVRAGFWTNSPYSGMDSWGDIRLFSDDTRGKGELGFQTFVSEYAVPAPATLALFGIGLAGLGWSRRKKV